MGWDITEMVGEPSQCANLLEDADGLPRLSLRVAVEGL